MKLQLFLLVHTFISSCLGFGNIITELSVKYFTLKGINLVCLLSCENSSGTGKTNKSIINVLVDIEFVKEASNHSIATLKVDLRNRPVDYDMIKKCFDQDPSVGILLNTNCDNMENVLTYVSQEMLFNAARKWLIVDQGERWNETNKSVDTINLNYSRHPNEWKLPMLIVLDKFNLSVDGDITVAVQEDPQTISLYEVFNYGKVQGGKLKVIRIGEWNPGKELNLNFLTYKYYRRWNFDKLGLRMIVVMSPQMVKFKPSHVTSTEMVPGISVYTLISSIVLHVVAEVHNIRYKYTVVDRWVGKHMQNSTPSVTRSLYFREQDISPVIRAYNKFYYLQFLSPPVTSIETRFYYRIPTQGPGKFENQFLRPLSSGAWLCVLAVGVLCVFGLLISSRVESRRSSMQYAVFSVVASICQQFFEDNSEMGMRRTTTGKMTVLVTGVSCVLIYNYYTSSVVSWLLSGPPPSINSLKELIESPLDLIFEDVGYTRSWLQLPDYYYNKRNAKIEDELKQKLNNKGGPLLVPVEKGIEMVKAGGYAYHTETYNANTLISRSFTTKELCELGSLLSMEKSLLYVCVQNDSPYKEFFVWSLLRLLERGIVSCIRNRLKVPDVSCGGSSPRALALGGAAPAFILLGAGYLLGFSVMIAERLPVDTAAGVRCGDYTARWLVW